MYVYTYIYIYMYIYIYIYISCHTYLSIYKEYNVVQAKEDEMG